MANFKRKRLTQSRRTKAGGYVVKGVTRRHWWDRWDKDCNSSRAQLHRDTRREIEEWLL